MANENRFPLQLLLSTVVFLLCLITSSSALAFEWTERRKDQFGKDFSYFIYPIGGDIPGLGSASGPGTTILNINESDLDFTAFAVDGDFSASAYTLLDYHFIKNRLIMDFGYVDFDVAPTQFKRGIDSDKNDFILPRVNGQYLQAQLTLSYLQRQFEIYFRLRNGTENLKDVRDKDGNPFPAIDSEESNKTAYSLGLTLDNTDDRLDPRRGYRAEFAIKGANNTDEWSSDTLITDYNFTAYLPMNGWDTLAMNFFGSDAHVIDEVKADYDTLQRETGLGCVDMTPGPEQDRCLETEADFINQHLAHNRYGTATSLGGTQRLRSFANYRYYAAHAMFYGVEYRMNLTDERIPFDIYIAKGVRTGLQLAFFAEQGSVADRQGELFDTLKTSYGAGFRLVLSGVIIRADVATGTEGSEFILFINYPWSMFSVDQ